MSIETDAFYNASSEFKKGGPMTVFTIGYEGLDIEMFMQLLAQHGIDTIVDIRELPLSRKRGFSKNALASALRLEGHNYLHLRELGCPKPVRDRYRSDGNWGHYTQGFLKHLQGQQSALEQLFELTNSSNSALLCYEADFNLCHRSLVAQALHEQYDVQVRHIQH
jgi:uncharacterized protein (DUF488 family)